MARVFGGKPRYLIMTPAILYGIVITSCILNRICLERNNEASINHFMTIIVDMAVSVRLSTKRGGQF